MLTLIVVIFMNLFPQNVLDFDDRCFKNITMFDYIIYTTKTRKGKRKSYLPKEKNRFPPKQKCYIYMVFTP